MDKSSITRDIEKPLAYLSGLRFIRDSTKESKESYESNQLKLDATMNKLLRCVRVANLPEEPSAKRVMYRTQRSVNAICLAVESFTDSTPENSTAAEDPPTLYDVSDMSIACRNLHNHMRGQYPELKIPSPTALAFLVVNDMNSLIMEVQEEAKNLEKALDCADAKLLDMAKKEVEGIRDPTSLKLLSEIAANVDEILMKAVKQQYQALEGKIENSVRNLTAVGKSFVNVGERISGAGEAITRIAIHVKNSVDTARVGDSAIVTVGNTRIIR
ncbi:hypothetical protein BDV96DRAFT_601291 [Lophiotrema nucula]|uniref:Uncharacterized protein n=1 Tax=Lophiotrema nucula TaxID=690887 RepID=A0A6A5Z418_9PLEO|nr:hypothetical protein BDV96DRAFT_601291 [Lophiotrema nucula]